MGKEFKLGEWSPKKKNNKNFKILIINNSKIGVIKRRQPPSVCKAIKWLRHESIGTVKIKFSWGHGDNTANLNSLEEAIKFLGWNWEDFNHYKGEK